MDTGDTASLVRFRWLEHPYRIFERRGYREVSTYPLHARSRFGDGCLGEVRHAADVPVGVAGSKGKFTAFALDADIPVSLRKGASETAGGRLDF